jgi:hypothetical protein
LPSRRHLENGRRGIHIWLWVHDLWWLGHELLGLLDELLLLGIGIRVDWLSDRDRVVIIGQFSLLLISKLLVISFLHVKFDKVIIDSLNYNSQPINAL